MHICSELHKKSAEALNTNTLGHALAGTTQIGSSKNRNAFQKQRQSLAQLRKKKEKKNSSTGILISAAQSTAQPAISPLLINKDQKFFSS